MRLTEEGGQLGRQRLAGHEVQAAVEAGALGDAQDAVGPVGHGPGDKGRVDHIRHATPHTHSHTDADGGGGGSMSAMLPRRSLTHPPPLPSSDDRTTSDAITRQRCSVRQC